MSRLDELIAELCPDGVPFFPLSEVASIDIGEFVRQDKQGDDKPYPVYNGGRNNTGMYDDYNHDGDYILISARGANAGFVNSIQGKYWAGNSCYSISINKSIIEFKFAFHYLKQSEKRFLGIQQKGSIPAVSKKQVSELRIPVPPLPVQREIVRILDSFTELTAELTAELAAELAARKKQYEYYKDTLLPFDEQEVEWKTLGEISAIVRGASPRPIKNYITEQDDGINWIKIGDVAAGAKYITQCNEKITPEGAEKSRKVKSGDFILSNSMSFGRPYILQIDGCIHDGWLAISDFDQYLNADIVRGISIPIPKKEQQHRIVSTLDRFSDLCTSISNGLPAEITARQKQYEYYRDKLLTFKQAEVVQ